MYLLQKYIYIIVAIQFIIVFYELKSINADNNIKVLTEKAYAKLFQLRRKESKELLNIIMNEHNYERKYKLIEAAFDKLLKILTETMTILTTAKYDPMVDKFPSQNTQLLDAITVTLENTSLFAEIILHMPDISYRALETRQNRISNSAFPHWKDILNWCIKYSRYFNDRIIDAKGQQLLWLAEQEINPERRTAEYVNPYRSSTEKELHKKTKKKVKSTNRGPKLVARDEF